MEKENIIILDEGMEAMPVGPESFCCAVVYAPYTSY
jgi:hypothetical protein